MRKFRKKDQLSNKKRHSPEEVPLRGVNAGLYQHNIKVSNRKRNTVASIKEKIPRQVLPNNTSTRFRHWIIVCSLFVLFIVAIYIVIVSPNANIVIVQPTGFNYQALSMSQYKSAVDKALNASIYNRFKPTLSTYDITASLNKSLPDVGYVAVTVPLIGSTPTVYIQLAQPILIYQNSTNGYVIDSNGNIVADKSVLSPADLSKLPVVSSSSNGNYSVGQQILSSDNVKFIHILQLAFKAKNIVVSKYVIVPGTEQLNVYLANESYYIKFDLHQSDALLQVGTYLAAITTLRQQGIVPSQYINVMVSGRAFYK